MMFFGYGVEPVPIPPVLRGGVRRMFRIVKRMHLHEVQDRPARSPKVKRGYEPDTATGDYLTVDELAARLKCSKPSIWRMKAAHWTLGHHYVQPLGEGSTVLFDWPAIKRWLHMRPTDKPKQNEKLSKEDIRGHIASRANALLR